MPPPDPSAPPSRPHMVPPESAPQFGSPPLPPHGAHHTGYIPVQPPRPANAPSPIGLIVAGVGLALLCVSMLLPRIKIEDPEGVFSFYSYSGLLGGSFAIDTSSVVLTLALLAAVGLSAHRNPNLRWPARIGAVGAAAIVAVFAYHPVSAMRQYAENFTGYDVYDMEQSASEIAISADNGVYIAIFAAAILATSAFLMHVRMPRQYPAQQYAAPHPAAPYSAEPYPNAGSPAAGPTITVNPG